MTIEAAIDRVIQNLEIVRSKAQDFDRIKPVADFGSLFDFASARIVATQNPNRTIGADADIASLESEAPPKFADLKFQNLLASSQTEAVRSRPNMMDFMHATGASAADASELLYGVIGSNADLRDWAGIMASGNPIDAARAATRQMYNSDREYELVNHHEYGTFAFNAVRDENSLSSKVVLRTSGNFAEIQPAENIKETFLVSSSGLLLRGTGSTPEQMSKAAWLFGFDLPDWVQAGT